MTRTSNFWSKSSSTKLFVASAAALIASLSLILLAPLSADAASATTDYWRFKVSAKEVTCDSSKVVLKVKFKGGSDEPVTISLEKNGQFGYIQTKTIEAGEMKKLKDKVGLAYGETANYAVVAYTGTEPAEPVGNVTVSRPTEAECNSQAATGRQLKQVGRRE